MENYFLKPKLSTAWLDHDHQDDDYPCFLQQKNFCKKNMKSTVHWVK